MSTKLGIVMVAAAIVLVSCGGGKDSDESRRAAFCAGMTFDYVRAMDLTVSGNGPPEGVEAAPRFLKLLYTADFVDGSPDTDSAARVAEGAEKAANGTLKSTEADGYVSAFDTLKKETADVC